MKKSIKKISALALMMVFMTESVSAAGINSVIHLTGETVSRLNNGFNRLVDAFDNTTSGMAFDELISGSAIDETTSGQAFEKEAAERILNDGRPYGTLTNVEKRILNCVYGVREDTMLALQEKGYSLKASITPALVMQRMNFDVFDADKMINSLGEGKALNLSERYRNLVIANGEWKDNEYTAENIAKLMAEGYDENRALRLFVMSQSLNKSVEDIKANGAVQSDVKDDLSVESAYEVATEAVMEVSTEAISDNTLNFDISTEWVSNIGAKTEVSEIEDTDNNVVEQSLSPYINEADKPAAEVEKKEDSYAENNNAGSEDMSDIAKSYGINEWVLKEYAQENGLSRNNINDIISSKAEELGVNLMSTSTDEGESEKDKNRPKGPFLAAEGINDSIVYSTGAVMYKEPLLSLPGVNGLDLNLSLNYDSAKRFRYDDNGYEVFNNDNDVWNFGFTRLTNELGGDIGNDINEELSSIKLADGSVYDLSYKKATSSSPAHYVLREAPFDDIKVYRDSSAIFTTPKGGKSAYYVTYLNGTREFFDSSGNYIGSEDRYKNRIYVDYENNIINKTGKTTITDSVGRTVTITYSETSNEKIMTIIPPDGENIVCKFTKTNLNEKYNNYVWKLSEKKQTVDGQTLTTSYSYRCNYNYYTKKGSNSSYRRYMEILLERVSYPTGMTLNYTYEKGKTADWSSDQPSYESNHYQYNRVVSRYYVVNGQEKNKTQYDYSETNYTGYVPDDYREDEYTYYVEVIDDTDVYARYTFDDRGLNTLVEWEKWSAANRKYVVSHTKEMGYSKTGKKYENDNNEEVELYTVNPTYIEFKQNLRKVIERYEYNNDGQIKAYYSPLSGDTKRDEYKTTYVYGNYGMLQSKTYKQNAATTIVESNTFYTPEKGYGIDTSTVKVNDVVKAKTKYAAYDGKGNPLTVHNYTNAEKYITTTYTYYDNGLLKSTSKGGVTQSIEYDSMGRITSQTDGKGGVTAYTYDTMGNVLTKTTPTGSRESYAYDYINNKINYTNPRGNKIDYAYDQAGNLLSVKSGNDTLATYTYNSHMLCEQEIVGNTVTRYDYDAFDRKTSVTVCNSGGTVYSKIDYGYDSADLTSPSRTTIENKNADGKANNIVEDSDVNELGLITAKYNALKGHNGASPVYKYEYDYLGNPIKEYVNIASVAIDSEDSDYVATTYGYDYAGRVTSETDSYSKCRTNIYDMLGRKVAEKDKNDNASNYGYDAFNHMIAEQHQLVGSYNMNSGYTYDANGNLIRKITNNGVPGGVSDNEITKYAYDGDNRVTKVTSVDSGNKEYYTEYEYDANGNCTAVKSANGANVTTYVYDKYNRVTKMTDPMGYTENYTYDIAGNMLSKKDRNGRTISYTYDPANRLTKEYCGSAVRAEYTYDMAGNKIVEKNADVTVKSVYGNDNTLTKSSFIYPGQTDSNYEVTYSYNARNLVTERWIWIHRENHYKDYESISGYYYSYDNNGRMLTVKDSLLDSAHIYASYTYDANGNMTSQTLDNGVNYTYGYNKANLPVSMEVKSGAASVLKYTMDYYRNGNLKSSVRNMQGKAAKNSSYTYDNLGRLKTENMNVGSVTDTYTYSYDNAGNRSALTATGTENYTTSYIYDKNNRLLKERKVNTDHTGTFSAYVYDKNGNTLITRNGAVNYDDGQYNGQLGIYLESEQPYTVEKNTYDVFNRLTSTKTDKGTTATYKYYPNNLRLSKQVGNSYTGYMWDGSQTVAEFDKSFNLTNVYAFGAGQQRIIGTNLSTNAKTYYIYNPHGDVQELAGANGSITKTYDYDAFGNEIGKAANDTNPWRYCGEYYDTETDNIYLRNRYYNPALGRFITEDPIRSGGNWYSYCGGNPIKFRDTFGLRCVEGTDITDKQRKEQNKLICEILMKGTNRNIFRNKEGALVMGNKILDINNEHKTKSFRTMFGRMVNSDKTVTLYCHSGIHESVTYNDSDINARNGVGCGATIKISPYGGEAVVSVQNNQLIKTPSQLVFDMAHELSHGDQTMRGVRPDEHKVGYVIRNGNIKYAMADTYDELVTVGIVSKNDPLLVTENMVRQEMGYKARRTYNIPDFLGGDGTTWPMY